MGLRFSRHSPFRLTLRPLRPTGPSALLGPLGSCWVRRHRPMMGRPRNLGGDLRRWSSSWKRRRGMSSKSSTMKAAAVVSA